MVEDDSRRLVEDDLRGGAGGNSVSYAQQVMDPLPLVEDDSRGLVEDDSTGMVEDDLRGLVKEDLRNKIVFFCDNLLFEHKIFIY